MGGGLQAISTARSLKNAGYVVGIVTHKKDYAVKSSALSYVHKVDKSITIHILIDILKKHTYDALIPMSDEYTDLLSKNQTELYQTFKIRSCVPDYDILKIAGDKSKLMEYYQQYSFPHPMTVSIGEKNEFFKELDRFPFPALIKPNHSVGARGITMVSNSQELLSIVSSIESKFGKCHLQEYIDVSSYYNVMIYRDKHGKILNHCILEIIRYYPLDGGSSSMCRTIGNDELVQMCTALLEKMDYVGFADFDVLRNDNGELKIIEINPRVPASLRGAEISGINFPAIMVADTLNKQSISYEYIPGKTLRYLGLDLMWFISSSNRFKSNPSWFKFIGKDIFYQEGGWCDLRAATAAFLSNLNRLEIRKGKLCKKVEL